MTEPIGPAYPAGQASRQPGPLQLIRLSVLADGRHHDLAIPVQADFHVCLLEGNRGQFLETGRPPALAFR